MHLTWHTLHVVIPQEGTRYGLILVCEQLVVWGSGKKTVEMERVRFVAIWV